MNLVGLKVFHDFYGSGVIVSQDAKYFTVVFFDVERKFQYPEAFRGFLTLDNEKVGLKIQKTLKDIDFKKREEKIRELADKKKRIENENMQKMKGQISQNIAFKCNYCDGGRTQSHIGYYGVCSDEMINYNILKAKKTWCAYFQSPCMKYLSGNLGRQALDELMLDGGSVCYESQLLREWKAFAGVSHSGKNKDKPLKLKQVKENSLAILTTRLPGDKEESRIIFGVFLVKEKYEGDHLDEGFVQAHLRYRVSLNLVEAKKLLFWNYHANKNLENEPRWSSGLFRYFNNEEGARILEDIVKLKKGTREERLAKEFYNHFVEINHIIFDKASPHTGALNKSKSMSTKKTE